MLGKLQRRAAMADREQRFRHRLAGTGEQFLLERTIGHLVDQEGGTRSQLDFRRRRGTGQRGRDQNGAGKQS
jgi:hypothetical protein